MKTKIFALLSLAAALPAGQAFAQDPATDLRGDCGMVRQVSIYGTDNREEYCSGNVIIRDLADSVAGFFSDGSSVTLTGQDYVFGTTTLGQGHHVAPDQRFANQPASAFCTGFLVGDDLIATAGHCVRDHHASDAAAPKDHAGACQENLGMGDYCENIRVVFGFRKDLGGAIARSVPAGSVYKCVKVVTHSLKGGPDYTVFKLDRKVAGLRPLAINRANAGLSKKPPLFVIGHPSGLPLKIAGDASVISAGKDVFVNDNGASTKWVDKGYAFLTNLDTFHGNSGSPVFNLNTLLVEGILVSGDNDYEPSTNHPGQSQVTNYPQKPVSDMGKGVGEVCTKISVPAAKIPATGREKDMIKMNAKAKGKLYPAMMKVLIKRAAEQQQDGIIPIPNYIVPVRPKQDVQWI